MKRLRIKLLGEPRIAIIGQGDLHLPTRKALALLIYLASPAGVARSRDHLAGLLWSRNADEQARTNLRQSLSRLRKAMGEAGEAVSADAHEIELLTDFIETDIAKFEDLAQRSDIAAWQEAAGLLNGEFAAGFNINEPGFEDWIAGERRRVAELAISILSRLLGQHESEGDDDNAAATATKLLAMDPLEERAHQSLMRALANLGRFEAALQQYKICRDLLRKELDIEPSEEIRALNDEIAKRRTTTRHAANGPAVETDGLIEALAGEDSLAQTPTLIPNLPPQLQGLDLRPPARPSIVILPFSNLTGDPGEDYLAEGIRIDIQAALVKITGIFLIAAGAANAVRGSDAQTAGRAFGVRYALHGSIRRAGANLRISAELIDVEGGQAIWTEIYDRRFDDGFEVQDEIIAEIIKALDVKLLRGEHAAVWHKTLKDRDALESFYKGVQEFFKQQKDSMLRARRAFEAVDRMQPKVSTGATWVAMTHWFDAFKGWRDDPAESLDKAGEWSAKAVAMDDPDGQAHMVLSHVHLMNRRFDDALIVGREAVQLRPNCTNANGFFANVLHYCGDQRDAIDHVTWAIRYSPVYPSFFADVLSLALHFDASFDAAIAVAGGSLRLNPGGQTASLVTLASLWQKGDHGQARQMATQLTAADPAFSVKRFARLQPYRDPADLENYAAKIKAAGLPD
jgi:DNA-binding SARP family transcriptional activator/TolB-like protein